MSWARIFGPIRTGATTIITLFTQYNTGRVCFARLRLSTSSPAMCIRAPGSSQLLLVGSLLCKHSRTFLP